jgi:hypothetical protein
MNAEQTLFSIGHLLGIVYSGADGPLWRSAQTVLIRGERPTGQAEIALDDPQCTGDVIKQRQPHVPKCATIRLTTPDSVDTESEYMDLIQDEEDALGAIVGAVQCRTQILDPPDSPRENRTAQR